MKTNTLAVLALLATSTALCQKPYDIPATGPTPASSEPGLLFYLSGDHGFNADYAAGGVPEPNFLKDVKILPGGAKGSYLQCGDDQLLSYWAPGNIYAQRGTLSFFWRSREQADATEFPIFRVGYGDHSSWDMTWLRIDWNGHGFDAFVTDVNLNRTRVSYTLPGGLKPDQWVHLALAWDETSGIRFFVDGKLAGERAATGMFDAALDQFGPHSRIIAPTGVESSYNYDRGGDLDELRIYDRQLRYEDIATLATGNAIQPVLRTLAQTAQQQEWWHRYGWNRPNDFPAPLPAKETAVRKVEIHDVYDLKRWSFKGTDGIAETTWPGVYNRSPLTGRWDYFQLPDWDCYALSGKSVTFYMPAEPWNHLEIQGGASGRFDLLTPGQGNPDAVADIDQHDPSPQLAKALFERPQGQERTTHDLAQPITGERVRFTNAQQWWPIAEFGAYNVHPGKEPEGVAVLSFTVSSRSAADNPSLAELASFIHGRYPADQRATMVASAGAAAARAPRETGAKTPSLPLVHLLIPADTRGLQADTGHGTSYSWENMNAGLDGIAIDLPGLNLRPTHGEYIPLNIQIKDPIWTMRDMLDFSFSVKPNEPHTLWLDTRDRLLPNGKSLYLTIASASMEFGPAALEGMHIRLIFKSAEAAKPEHIADRITQARDNYANLVEESVNSRKLNIFNRVDADLTDLLRVDPTNDLGRKYWNEMNHEQLRPPYKLPPTPPGVPQWVWLQTRDLAEMASLIDWYIDNRQISDGEFGGGLSDDTDFLNWWPGLAMMGHSPDKLKDSLNRALEATFANGMWENGLARAQYDELHSYEDGINTLGQAMMMDYGSPKQIERAMATAKRLEWITGYNSAGQRQIRTAYYSGTKMAENGVWGWGKDRGYFVFHPALLLVNYNGTPETRKMITEVADGFLAHRRPGPNGKMQMHINVKFHTNEDLPSTTLQPWFVLWGAYKFTGDQKYLAPFGDDPPTGLRQVNADMLDILNTRDTWGKQLVKADVPERRTDSGTASEANNQLAWQVTGDTTYLEKVYASQLETAAERSFINREGSLWIDRVYFNNAELQRGRLGGVALTRNNDFPGNVVSWRFDPMAADPHPDQSVGILVPIGTPTHIRIVAYNMQSVPVKARMTGWEIDPGKWEMKVSVAQGDAVAVAGDGTSLVDFGRSQDLPVTFAPNAYTNIELTLKTPGVPYWSRPDVGIDEDDIKVIGQTMKVTVHSLGAVDAPKAKLVLRDGTGKVLATADIPALKAPTDLIPKTAVVTLISPAGGTSRTLSIETNWSLPETTLLNNRVELR